MAWPTEEIQALHWPRIQRADSEPNGTDLRRMRIESPYDRPAGELVGCFSEHSGTAPSAWKEGAASGPEGAPDQVRVARRAASRGEKQPASSPAINADQY